MNKELESLSRLKNKIKSNTDPGLGRRLIPEFVDESVLQDLGCCLSADSAPAPVRLRNVGLVLVALVRPETQHSVSGTGSRVKDLLIRS